MIGEDEREATFVPSAWVWFCYAIGSIKVAFAIQAKHDRDWQCLFGAGRHMYVKDKNSHPLAGDEISDGAEGASRLIERIRVRAGASHTRHSLPPAA